MTELFENLGVNPEFVKALKKQDILIPTEIQQRVIPAALKNKDIIAQSETGTGKTLAYLLPLYQKIKTDIKEMQAIVLVPTHELAIQVLRQIELLSQNSEIKITGTSIIGSVNILRQIDKLKEKPHIVVGTSGRILELIKKKKITAHTVKTIILDEGDKLLDPNNIESVGAVIKCTLKERQLMIFSATITKEAIEKAKLLMKEPELIAGLAKPSVPTTIRHIYFITEQRDKIDELRKLINILNPSKAIIFVQKTDDIEPLTEKLQFHGLNAEGIQGNNYKSDRKKVMEEFRNGKVQLLVSSDIATRGIDIEGISHIFNLELPEESQNYLHRVGRAGRKGNEGLAVNIIDKRELPIIKQYEKELKIKMDFKLMYQGKIVDSRPNFRNK